MGRPNQGSSSGNREERKTEVKAESTGQSFKGEGEARKRRNCFLAKNLRSWKDGGATNWGVRGGAGNLGKKAASSIPHTVERNKPKISTHFETVVLTLIDPEVYYNHKLGILGCAERVY